MSKDDLWTKMTADREKMNQQIELATNRAKLAFRRKWPKLAVVARAFGVAYVDVVKGVTDNQYEMLTAESFVHIARSDIPKVKEYLENPPGAWQSTPPPFEEWVEVRDGHRLKQVKLVAQEGNLREHWRSRLNHPYGRSAFHMWRSITSAST